MFLLSENEREENVVLISFQVTAYTIGYEKGIIIKK